MKKFFAMLLVTLVALSVVFAQGAKEEATAADAEPTELVIYSAASEVEARYISDAFNKLYPNIKISLIPGSSGDMITRINTEWPKPDGDIVLLIGSENLDQVYDKLEPYKSVNHDNFTREQRDHREDIPRYYGTSMPLQAFMYNTDLLSPEDAPKAWKDLADPKYKDMIVLANPATSGSAYAQLYMMNALYGMDFVKKVADNGTTYIASSKAGPESVARGEYAITVTGEANISRKISEGAHVAYVLPEEGTGLRIEGSAILKNCKHLKAAQLFIDFMTSKEAFQVVRDSCHRRAVSTEVPGPEGLPSLNEMTFFEYNAQDAAAQKKALRAEFESFI